MGIRYSNTAQLNYGSPSAVDKVIAKIPQGAAPIATAPAASATPIQVIDSDGKTHWALYHRDAWRTLAPERDSKTGAVQWRMNGDLIRQAVAWLPRQRQR
jgi:hypothetical protein